MGVALKLNSSTAFTSPFSSWLNCGRVFENPERAGLILSISTTLARARSIAVSIGPASGFPGEADRHACATTSASKVNGVDFMCCFQRTVLMSRVRHVRLFCRVLYDSGKMPPGNPDFVHRRIVRSFSCPLFIPPAPARQPQSSHQRLFAPISARSAMAPPSPRPCPADPGRGRTTNNNNQPTTNQPHITP